MIFFKRTGSPIGEESGDDRMVERISWPPPTSHGDGKTPWVRLEDAMISAFFIWCSKIILDEGDRRAIFWGKVVFEVTPNLKLAVRLIQNSSFHQLYKVVPPQLQVDL